MSDAVDLTLLVCTYNRCDDLSELLGSAVGQTTDGTFTYEVLVVDNNSSDGTREVVNRFISHGHTNVRYLFEGKQGKSHALNSGLAAAAGSIYAITDDDFILPPDWVSKIIQGFKSHPEASFISGKVLPLWEGAVPGWLGPEHWSALALADYGDEVFVVNEKRQVCLLACSFRKADVLAVGGYDIHLGVSGSAIGGVEDLEILQRLWNAGRHGVYLPSMSFLHKVQRRRLTKSYHRRWHTGHGRYFATLHDPDFERARARLFDIPSHVFGEIVRLLGHLGVSVVTGRQRAAFRHEVKLRFLLGFAGGRRRSFLASGGRTISDVAAFARTIMLRP